MAQPSYESLVNQGRKAAKAQWTLGDLAKRVEVAYGEGRLQEYAEDIGVDYRTLLDYRTVARAYEKSERSELPWSVHRVLASQEDRVALVTDGALTYRGAQALVRGRKEAGAAEAGPEFPPLETDTWMSRAVAGLRPLFAERAGIELPANIRASIGFPLQKGKGTDTIGQAWSGAADGVPQTYVSPEIGDPIRALDILVHELGHVAIPKGKHGKEIATLFEKVGLEGPTKETFAGPELKMYLTELAEELGPYPHSPVTPPSRRTVSTTTRDTEPNTFKFACVDCQSMDGDGEGYYVKITVPRGLLKDYGLPQMMCPVDGKLMEVIDE